MNSLYLKKFHGKFAQFVLKTSMLTDHGPAPVIETGYIIDMDNEFLYLGSKDPLSITKAILITDIVLTDTELPTEEDEEKFLLGDFESDDGDPDSSLN